MYIPYPKKNYIFSLSIIWFVYVKETSQRDVSFTHTKHVLYLVVRIVHTLIVHR